jgi:hypothetical protein|tara:strand:+ start:654 stop:1535 length:882 start_codon:yes stop_codon:yes gene_type:complete
MASSITNKHNLPQTLVNLAESRDYSRGNSDRSITQLIDSPQISILRMINDNRITEDVVDTFWANLGSALHHITEKGADDKHLVEERLFVDVEDWTISGAIDVQRLEDDGSITIMDYKFTSVWAVKNPKLDWERQLNCYAYLVATAKKVKIKEIQIVCFLRDWNRNNAKRDSNYPQQQIMVVPIKLWGLDEQREYVIDRVRTHQEALQDYMNGKQMKECSFEEMWKREDTYAVKKKKNKRALRVFENEKEAREFAKEKGEEYEIEFRKGLSVRCEDNYCKVNEWCPQYQQVLGG